MNGLEKVYQQLDLHPISTHTPPVWSLEIVARPTSGPGEGCQAGQCLVSVVPEPHSINTSEEPVCMNSALQIAGGKMKLQQ